MLKFNSEQVTQTLQKVIKILESNKIKYRFLGSVVMAAINGELHRKIGDLDIIIDSKDKNILFEELTKLGYKQAGGIFTLEHPSLLEVGYFYGNWSPDGSFIMGNKYINISVEPYALKETTYTLNGINFIGLPPEVIARGIKTSEKNPKRQKELEILKEKGIEPYPNSYIHVSIFGMRADWMYHFAMGILNILGDFRVKLGLPFDPWR